MRMASLVHSRETGELFEQPTKEYGELLGLLLAYSCFREQGKCRVSWERSTPSIHALSPLKAGIL